MGKIHDSELGGLAEIYNEKGKKELYLLLTGQHGIKNPTCVFKRMCKTPSLGYDKVQDRFFTVSEKSEPEDVFMSMEELCAMPDPEQSPRSAHKHNRNEAMEKMIRDLLGDRLLELSKYVTLDTVSKTLHVDESLLKNEGYRLLMH